MHLTEESAVLRALLALAQPDGAGWEGVLDRLAILTRARSALLTITTPGHEARWHHGPPMAALSGDHLRRMRPGRVYAGADLSDSPPAGPALRALRLPFGRDGTLLLALARPGPEFRAAETAALDRLAPLMATAAETYCALARERVEAARARQIERALGGDWLMLDDTARVIEAGPDLPALLGEVGLALTPEGRFLDPEAARRLKTALDQTFATGRPAPLVTLSRAPLTQIALMPEGPRRALGLIRRAPLAADLAPDTLATSLGLTRSEARLATRIADGDSLAEAAARLGLTLETTRSTSKAIFARLGLSGQGALIRLVQQSALWLIPR